MRQTREKLIADFVDVRAMTERLAAPLSAEDQCLQSMAQCSPTKWHRAHTTWFFETFLLAPEHIEAVDRRYSYLFNSYYEAIGPRHPRPQRGMLSRPSVEEISAYRRTVDGRMVELLERAPVPVLERLCPLLALGLAHEQQHQELLLTDILHALSQNPLHPAYLVEERATLAGAGATVEELRFVSHDGGVHHVGVPTQSEAFRFDNEEPRHRVFLEPFGLSDRLLNVGEWKAFAREGGYNEPRLWLSEGWDFIQGSGRRSPLYSRWDSSADTLAVFGLHGLREAVDQEPVTHVTYYEADAIARFMGARLPSEAEWEVAAKSQRVAGNFVDSGALRAVACVSEPRGTVRQLFGDAWEWTHSSYGPYPGYQPSAGAVGEYNGKFMVNQQVLRGGSCLTPAGHVRPSYRNFWPAPTAFQVSGIRLARSL